jgi:hypothetical protein
MTDSTQPAVPAHSSARPTACEPHAVSDRADVPIAATKSPGKRGSNEQHLVLRPQLGRPKPPGRQRRR